MPWLVLAAAVLALTPARDLAGEGPDGAAPPAAHDSETPIDCPLHGARVSPGALRPFAETERYIAFLDRPDRARWQKPDAVVAALRLKGDETLADVGAGSGYFTFRFAKALPRGKVVAIDIDPEMIRHVHHAVMTGGVRNVQAVLADPKDPGVPAAADVVFVCDVLHHVEGRGAWLGKLFAEMKPGARLIVVEFKEGKLPEGPPEAMKIPKSRLTAMLRAAGFVLERDDPKLLPYQTFLVFERPAGPAATAR